MRLLDRYLSREFTRIFMVFVLGAPVLFVIGDLVDNLGKYLDRGLTPGQVALGYVYQMPQFILFSFPVAALIATVFTVGNMTRHSEIAAAKAGGVSFHRLTLPLLMLGVLLTAAGFGLSELVPIGIRKRAEVMGERGPAQAARTDFVYRTADGQVYAVRRLDVAAGRIAGVSMEREGDEPAIPSVNVIANTAYFTSGAGWLLREGYLRLFAGKGNESSWQFQTLRPTHLTATPEQLLAIPKSPDEMGYRELGRFIDILRHSGGKPFGLMVKRDEKIAIPVATLIIILFGAPLANSSARGGAAYGIGISLGITVIYMMLLRVSGGMGAGGSIPPLLAAWLPNIIFFGAGLGLQARVKT